MVLSIGFGLRPGNFAARVNVLCYLRRRVNVDVASLARFDGPAAYGAGDLRMSVSPRKQ